ncbi:glycosyl hydrolase family 28 protein [Streptosporangium sp. NPDC000396]|uniref:glycosyl hydrolase family 28 protein n=1 Tax=Streptosporangium sp. NPDC000396 TaxID=3366185 RepID=UPI003673989C
MHSSRRESLKAAALVRVLVALALTFFGLAVLPALPVPASALAEFNVRDYGATGNGSTNDDDAIDRAISDASAAVGGVVVFPSGRYRSRSVHLKSNVTLRLDSGAVLLAAGGGMDAPEPNPAYDDYQDFGHSHFHNSLMWGHGITDFHITGAGTIDGDGKLSTSNSPPSGAGNKALALTECSNVSISGVTFRRGGHFAILMNGCHDVAIDNLKTVWAGSGVRDGVNIINSWNVTVADSRIESNDDAIVLKSDFALGHTYTSQNIRVRDTTVYSHENNALQFGSETCGNFRDIRFDGITVLGAGKAGIGMVSMDGAIIEDVHYTNVTLTKTTTPIFMKIGERKRCPGSPPAGRIRNIHLTNVTGSDLTAPEPGPVTGGPELTSTITGTPAVDIGPDITLTGVKLTVPGGHPASDATIVPGEFLTSYPPRDYGTRPSYGFWARHVQGLTFDGGSEVRFQSNDNRPAFIADDGANIRFDGVIAQRGSGSAYDAGVSGVNGYLVTGATTSGGTLRVRATDSTPIGGDPVSLYGEAESGTVTAPMQIQSDPAASAGSYVTVAAGNNSQSTAPATGHANVTFTVPSAGSFRVFARVVAPTTSDDSFWVRADGGAWTNWNGIPPGSAWHWATVPVTYGLTAGGHTVTFAYREDGARLDRIAISSDPAFVPSDGPAPAPVRLEAEDATISQGAVESNHPGFTGTGFVNYDNVTGSSVEFTVTAATAGNATATLRYANGTTANRPMDIAVNGTVVSAARAFNGTGAWTTWATTTLTVPLAAGANTLRATAVTAGGGPNLDHLDLVGP